MDAVFHCAFECFLMCYTIWLLSLIVCVSVFNVLSHMDVEFDCMCEWF